MSNTTSTAVVVYCPKCGNDMVVVADAQDAAEYMGEGIWVLYPKSCPLHGPVTLEVHLTTVPSEGIDLDDATWMRFRL